MLTLCQRYGKPSVGEGDLVTVMQIWDKLFYVIPLSEAASRYHVSRRWLSELCQDHRLIAIKRSGSWWIAENECVKTSISGGISMTHRFKIDRYEVQIVDMIERET